MGEGFKNGDGRWPGREKVPGELEWNSPEWAEAQEKEHNRQEHLFTEAGWGTLNVSRPFYMEKGNGTEGERRTVANVDLESDGSGFNWFVIGGEVEPPEGACRSYSVTEYKDGKWRDVYEMVKDGKNWKKELNTEV